MTIRIPSTIPIPLLKTFFSKCTIWSECCLLMSTTLFMCTQYFSNKYSRTQILIGANVVGHGHIPDGHQRAGFYHRPNQRNASGPCVKIQSQHLEKSIMPHQTANPDVSVKPNEELIYFFFKITTTVIAW